jgi:hypothetical protein
VEYPQFVIQTHISTLEEAASSVPESSTLTYRRVNAIPNSDGIEAIRTESGGGSKRTRDVMSGIGSIRSGVLFHPRQRLDHQ